jgi:hypothetical protein
LAVELVIVSVSPVPKLEPGPVSNIQLADEGEVPADPLKSSLKAVVQPAGGPGAAAWAVVVNVTADSRAPTVASTASQAGRLLGTVAWFDPNIV